MGAWVLVGVMIGMSSGDDGVSPPRNKHSNGGNSRGSMFTSWTERKEETVRIAEAEAPSSPVGTSSIGAAACGVLGLLSVVLFLGYKLRRQASSFNYDESM